VRVAVPRWLHREFAVSVRFSPDGGTVYAATGRGLRAWDAATGNDTTTRVMREQAGVLASKTLAVAPDGKTVIVNTVRDEVGHLTLVTPAGAYHMRLPDLFAAELSPDGGTLVAVVRGVGVLAWAVEESDGKPALRPLSETRETVLSARFGRDGKTVFAVGVNRDVLAIDPLTGQEQVTLSGHPDRIVGLGLLPKDAGLITIGRDGVVKRWRAEPLSRQELRLWDRPMIRPRAPDLPAPPRE
jgi:WD40 repeat protein